jgi:beta-lactamase regulating signal transducer with metallopeptidase domain
MNNLIETFNFWGPRFTAFAQSMLVQSAILIAFLFVADLLLREKVRATVRYALWMLVLVKLVMPPSLKSPTGVAYWLPKHPSAPLLVTGPGVVDATVPARAAATATASSDSTASRPAFTWPAILFIGWLTVFIGLAARVASRFRYVVRMLGRTEPAPESLEKLLESCRQQLGIRRTVQLRCVPNAISPAICGLFRPVIVIPSALPETLSQSELRSILLHELVHFKRGDLWISHAQILMQLFYWYNPLVWLANAVIRRVREQAVDERVLVELREEAESYPATLVQVAKLALRRPAQSIGFVGILEPGSSLNQRIRHMINHPIPRTAGLGIGALLVVALIALVVLPMGKGIILAADAPPARQDALRDAINGMKLTAEQAQELEAKLKSNPEDMPARTQLLGAYQQQQFKSPEARRARQGHVLWLVEHHPEADVLATSFGGLDRVLDGSVYEQAKTLWLKNVQANPKRVAILGNAANFCSLQDRPLAEDFFKQAQALEPKNPEWATKLAQLYQRDVNYPQPGASKDVAKKALEQMERAQADTLDAGTRFSNLDYLASMAFNAGETAKAKTYATEYLQKAEQNSSSWAYGNAINHGNVVLGRIALLEGNLDEAKKHLLAAGASKGSPQLNSFGPNMALANELLEKGEKETVLDYLKLCGNFWKSGANKLDRWAKEVNAGLAPDFGANLNY